MDAPEIRGRHTALRLEAPSLMQLADQAATVPAALSSPLHFNCPPSDMACIAAIVYRANEIGRSTRPPVQFETVIAAMDIAAVHCNGTPLKLEQFLMSAPVDFMHDFSGIGLHVDRSSGRLRHGWRPIFARHAK